MNIIFKLPVLVAIIAMLGGCAVMEPVMEENASSRRLMPISQSIYLKGGSNYILQSKNELAHFIDGLEPNTLSEAVSLRLYSGEGVLLQGYARQQLLAAGVPQSNIKLQDLTMNYDPVRNYDFELKVVKYEMAEIKCSAATVGMYYDSITGCFVESARMRSLVNGKAVQTLTTKTSNK